FQGGLAMHKRAAVVLVACLAVVGYGMAQSSAQNQPASGQQPATQGTSQASAQPVSATTTPAEKPDKARSDATTPASPVKVSLNATRIPSGSRVYVAPMGGFENYVVAGIVKKKVPVVIVAERDKAEYEIKGSAETERAGWAKMLFMGSQNSNEQA